MTSMLDRPVKARTFVGVSPRRRFVDNVATVLVTFSVLVALVPLLWFLARRRFELVTGRVALLRPERVMPRRRKLEPKKALLIDAEPPANGQKEDDQRHQRDGEVVLGLAARRRARARPAGRRAHRDRRGVHPAHHV